MILDEIAVLRKEQLAAEIERISRSEMEQLAAAVTRPVLDFEGALRKPGMTVIAEVKKASPSKSVICEDFHPVEQAVQYEAAGAGAISCLTEEHYFKGSSEYLKAIRAAVNLPILRKDFIIDPYQIDEARVIGADAILLIAALLDDATMQQFYAHAQRLGLHVLFESHTAEELERVIKVGARICGINNRNLKTFEVTLKTSEALGARIPEDRVFVSESGIKTPEDMQRLAACGADAVLIGETLMRSGNVVETMQRLREGI